MKRSFTVIRPGKKRQQTRKQQIKELIQSNGRAEAPSNNISTFLAGQK